MAVTTRPAAPATTPVVASDRLERWAFGLLLAAIVTAPLGSNVHVPGHPSIFPFRVFLVLFVLAEVAARRRAGSPRRPGLLSPVVLWSALTVWALLSVLWAGDRGAAVRWVLFLLQAAVLIYAVWAHGQERRRLALLLTAAGVSFLLVTAGALYERATGYRFPESMLRDPVLNARFSFEFTSFFHNANDLGTFLSLWLPLLLVAYLTGSRLWLRAAALLLAAVSGFLIVTTLSRANTVSITLSVLVLFAFTVARHWKPWLLLVGACAVLFVLMPGLPRYAFSLSVHHLTSDVASGAASTDTRAQLAEESLTVLRRSHGLGVGAGNAEAKVKALRIERHKSDFSILNMHNWWMEVLVNLGVLGFALYVLLYGAMLVGLLKTWRRLRAQDPAQAALALGLLASLIGLMIGCVSSSSVLMQMPVWLQFAFAGAVSQAASDGT